MSDQENPPEENWEYCTCNICSGQIDFDANLFQAGARVVCPHCGMETALYIQKNNEGITSTNPPAASKKGGQQTINLQKRCEAIDFLLTGGGTDCPSCGSAQTQRLEMAFTMGISKQAGNAVGVDLQGDVGVGSYGGRSQTGLSVATRPPERKPVLMFYLGGLLLGGFLYLIIVPIGEFINPYIGLCFLIGFMVLVHKFTGPNRRYNAQIHPWLINRWQAAWICLRCGKRWIPEK